ncbi:MAG: VWA domain-containing protein, partial [Planctomycetota bacterium]
MNAFFESLTGLRFVDPWMLALALLLPLGLWLGRRAKGAALPFAPLALLEGESLPESPRQRLLPLPPALQLLALLCFVLALARPGRRVELPRERAGIDIFLCLDVSSSMAAKDMDPERTRLELARDAAARFIAGRPDDRIGLIRFARYPDLLCPLTLDHHALLGFLGELEQVDPDGQE